MTYTAIGDVENPASRLEAIVRPQQILISEATRDAGDELDYVDAGEGEVSKRPLHLLEVRS